jgi:hypothetical protein
VALYGSTDELAKGRQEAAAAAAAAATDGEDGCGWQPEDSVPVDNCLQSVLSGTCAPKFSDRFVQHYEKWLDEEVFRKQVDWDALLLSTRGMFEKCMVEE